MKRWLLLGLAVGACGGSPPARGRTSRSGDFVCNERRAEYLLVGGFVAAESGVTIDCKEAGPRLLKWSLPSGASERVQRSFSISGEEFDELWQQLDDAGWRNLDDCVNPAAADGDPVYTFDIADYASRITIACPGKELPFPYDRLVNAFDLKAAELGE